MGWQRRLRANEGNGPKMERVEVHAAVHAMHLELGFLTVLRVNVTLWILAQDCCYSPAQVF